MDYAQRYYLKIAAAYLRGAFPAIREQFPVPLDLLSESELEQVFELGEKMQIDLYRFKRTMALPRVSKVLGHLMGLQPINLLDIGTGRGVFLNPLLDQFLHLEITCIDLLDHRVQALNAIQLGGYNRLHAFQMNACALAFQAGQFDTVTALEVLEHIPEIEKAVSEICRVANRNILISVPSKEDNNPEHIHLLSTEKLASCLKANGWMKIKHEYVLNHLIVIAQK